MTFEVVSSFLFGIFIVASHAAAFVEGGVSSSEPSTRFEPQVAFVCGSRNQYHAQYMNSDGRWITDDKTKVTCLKEKVDMLQYCKQVYPKRDITNIVEMSEFVKVSNFCRVGHSKCKTTVRVKPYRCLEGLFQSDALLVPEGCLFDHIHNQSRCWEYDRWNATADLACQGRQLNLKAFAMLLPCGIDIFSGVEFVCCPSNYKSHGKVHTMEIEEPVALPQTDQRVTPTLGKLAKTQEGKDQDSNRDEYFGRFDPHQEHDAFRKAEQRLEEKHREKVSKIMKEWSELEERYQELHAKDPTGAEEFKHRMTQRFQSTVQTVEAENEAEKHQLTQLHQQRIVAHINEMKREAMTCFTRAVNEEMPNTHKVQKCLQRLLRSLNKDRHHTVSHFKHLLNTDYESADRERDSTLQHLADLDKMVNQSLNMLRRNPDLYAKIGRLMHEYSNALKAKDSTPAELMPRPIQDDKEDLDYDEEDYEDDSDEDDDEDEEDDDDDLDDEDDEDEDEMEDEEDNEIEDNEIESKDASLKSSHRPTFNEESHSAVSTDLPADKNKNTHDMPPTAQHPAQDDAPSVKPAQPVLQQVEQPRVAHAQHHVFSQKAAGFSVVRDSTKSHSGSDSRGVYFTLAFAGVALMGAMVVGIVVLRRRNNLHPHNQGFMEVDQAITPEERHVANMQVNGYENPTYKYFEEK